MPVFPPKTPFSSQNWSRPSVRPSRSSLFLPSFRLSSHSNFFPLATLFSRSACPPATGSTAVSGSLRKGLLSRVLKFSSGLENFEESQTQLSVSATRIYMVYCAVPNRRTPSEPCSWRCSGPRKSNANEHSLERPSVFLPFLSLSNLFSILLSHSSFKCLLACLGNYCENLIMLARWLSLKSGEILYFSVGHLNIFTSFTMLPTGFVAMNLLPMAERFILLMCDFFVISYTHGYKA